MQKADILKRVLYRSSPTILTVAGAFGVIVTAVTASQATPKALQIVKQAQRDRENELSKLEIVRLTAPVYFPVVLIGTATISCIFGATILNRRQQASLASAYALVNQSYKEYRRKLIELHGEETDIEVRTAMAREHCNYHQLNLDVPDGKAIFYDEISGRTVERYEREIMDAEYHFNRNFTLRGYAFLNEFYEFLGLPRTDYGGIAGWSVCQGISWVDFEHRLIEQDDGGPALYSIDMVIAPEVLEEWEC